MTQDDFNDGANQNFKLVPLEHILGTPPTVNDSACSSGGAGGSGGSSGAGGNSSGGSAGAGGNGRHRLWRALLHHVLRQVRVVLRDRHLSEGDCVFQVPKTAFTLTDCKAGCAVAATPGVAAKAALSPGFENLSCTAFDDAI